MCGFVGFSDRRAAGEKKEILQRMMQRIVHRGPDMESSYADEKIGMGFRRLSIMDLTEAGKQPMYSEDKKVISMLNGEVYNYKQLRKELEEKGHTFASNSDAEVVLHGYEEYGEKIVTRLRGMFAFVIWDTKTDSMMAARDPFGIKPFYYAPAKDGGILYASEIKSFLEYPEFKKEVNPNMLRSYLTLQYGPGEETFFKDVNVLMPGHYFIWKNGEMRTECYYDIHFDTDASLGYEQCADMIDQAVHESVQAHSVSDVKVGGFLSGGVDSSYITACFKPELTFSVGFEQPGEQDMFNETNYAAELSEKLGIQNKRKLVTAQECFDAFPEIQYHMDQPQANPSSVPLWFLAKMAREDVTVVLSGEGADELFGGYDLYVDTPRMTSYKKIPKGLRRAIGSVAKILPETSKQRNFLVKGAERPEDWFVGQAEVFQPKEACGVLKKAYQVGPSSHDVMAPYFAKAPNKNEIRQKQYVDIHVWMPGDILLKADKMCMAHSLELRVPFLDTKMMDMAGKIPPEYCVKGSESKMVFRHASNRTLPDEWANRPKKGFPVPIRHWLREEKYYNTVREYFAAQYAAEFFEQDKILKLLDDHYNGHANNARKIWVIFTFLTWYKRFFVDEKAAV